MDRGRLDFDFTSNTGGLEERTLKPGKGDKEVRGNKRGPGFAEGFLKHRGLSKPTGDGGPASNTGGIPIEGQPNREVVRERGPQRRARTDREVGQVMGDTDRRGEDRVGTDRERDEKAVQTRGTGVDRERVRGDMVMSMRVVGDLIDVELLQERLPRI